MRIHFKIKKYKLIKIRNIILFLIFLIMLFLVAETILKIHFYNTTPWKTYRNIPKMFEYDQELGFRMISNFKGIKTDPDGIKTEISINQFGLRGLDFSREKKKEYRICSNSWRIT